MTPQLNSENEFWIPDIYSFSDTQKQRLPIILSYYFILFQAQKQKQKRNACNILVDGINHFILVLVIQKRDSFF